MGMFDDVRCDHPLPEEPTGGKRDFQTKDLECMLDHYRITEGGRLVVRSYGAGAERDTNFHGVLNFYTYTGKANSKDFEWWQYQAKFTDGKLVKITGGKENRHGRRKAGP